MGTLIHFLLVSQNTTTGCFIEKFLFQGFWCWRLVTAFMLGHKHCGERHHEYQVFPLLPIKPTLHLMGVPRLWHHLILVIFQALLPTRVNIPSKIKSAPYKKVQMWSSRVWSRGRENYEKLGGWQLRPGQENQTNPTKSGYMLQNIGRNLDLNLTTGAGEREMAQCKAVVEDLSLGPSTSWVAHNRL